MADKYAELVRTLISLPTEEEWFEFKENWFESYEIGEYISALSNAAAMCARDYAYLVWGVCDDSHEIVGTTVKYKIDIKKEPFLHYLARQVTPDVGFEFHETTVSGKRVVILEIPAARRVPTTFNGVRYLRIGSSKENASRYPEREARLFDVLNNGVPTIETVASEYQDLTFGRLFTYYAGRGIELRRTTFKKNLGLLTKDGKYNILAQLLSDDCRLPIRLSRFLGKSKADPLHSVREFGNTCLLIALEKLLDYGDALNVPQADERDRKLIRKEVMLFNSDAFREAIINAFVHNKWVDGNGPMITFYSDRLEILSRGSLAPNQTMEGFFMGESVPVNRRLADIFLQLHISERSGRGVPKITGAYGKSVFEFRQNSIVVVLPFNILKHEEEKTVETTVEEPGLTKIQEGMLLLWRDNPNLKQEQVAAILGVSLTSVQKNTSKLKDAGYIERVGSPKRGYWKVLK